MRPTRRHLWKLLGLPLVLDRSAGMYPIQLPRAHSASTFTCFMWVFPCYRRPFSLRACQGPSLLEPLLTNSSTSRSSAAGMRLVRRDDCVVQLCHSLHAPFLLHPTGNCGPDLHVYVNACRAQVNARKGAGSSSARRLVSFLVMNAYPSCVSFRLVAASL